MHMEMHDAWSFSENILVGYGELFEVLQPGPVQQRSSRSRLAFTNLSLPCTNDSYRGREVTHIDVADFAG